MQIHCKTASEYTIGKMNTFRTYTSAGAALFLLLWGATGCKKTPVEVEADPTAVSFALKSVKENQASAAASKAIGDDEFLTNSMLGMFAAANPMSSVATAQYQNIAYINPQGSSVWSVPDGAQPIYFPANGAAMDFCAYHPHSRQSPTTTAYTAGNTWVDYTLPSDQSTKADLKNADLLWGKVTGRTQSQGTVNIEFHHKLAKLSLKIKKGTDWNGEELKLASVVVSGANVLQKAKLDLNNGTLSPTAGSPTQVSCAFAPAQALSVLNEYVCEFILIPAPAQDITLQFVYDNNGGQSQAVLTSGLTFKSGTQLNVRVSVNKFSPTELSVSPTMAAWNFTSQVEVDGI